MFSAAIRYTANRNHIFRIPKFCRAYVPSRRSSTHRSRWRPDGLSRRFCRAATPLFGVRRLDAALERHDVPTRSSKIVPGSGNAQPMTWVAVARQQADQASRLRRVSKRQPAAALHSASRRRPFGGMRYVPYYLQAVASSLEIERRCEPMPHDADARIFNVRRPISPRRPEFNGTKYYLPTS